jgi:hypothetical protein
VDLFATQFPEIVDEFAAQCCNASEGDFIKDLSPRKRSLGLVVRVNKKTRMMQVKFPKIGKLNWILWNNYGHYIVV